MVDRHKYHEATQNCSLDVQIYSRYYRMTTFGKLYDKLKNYTMGGQTVTKREGMPQFDERYG